MRILKIILIPVVLCVVSALSISCASESDSTAVTEDQVVTVQRGDLVIDVIASGNLAFSDKEELAFEVSGTVEEVLVEEGDSVEEGQVLARLDTSEWEEQLDALEDNVTTAESKLTTAERNLTSAERSLTATERNLATKQSSLIQVEINLKNAQIALTDAEDAYYGYGVNLYYRITITKKELEIEELKLGLAEMRLEEAQNAVVDAEQGIVDAQQGIVDAEQAVVDALQTVEDAQQELDEAISTSLVIEAPFAGLVTVVNISTGDVVKKGLVALILADPTKFEAAILVNETDIFNIREGARASIEVEAIPGISLPARVTRIAPTATIQAGVVNYKVNVELESSTPLEPLVPSEQQEQQTSGLETFYERLESAVKAGLISQEQADRMKERLEQGAGGFSQEQMDQFRERFEQGLDTGQRPQGMMMQVLTLREGLTVTVSVIIQERNDVLLVPNQAIIRQGSETYVQVLADGVIEQRLVQTGLSDWQYTEITDGLSEGEKIVIPQATTTPTTPQPRGMPFFGGGR